MGNNNGFITGNNLYSLFSHFQNVEGAVFEFGLYTWPESDAVRDAVDVDFERQAKWGGFYIDYYERQRTIIFLQLKVSGCDGV